MLIMVVKMKDDEGGMVVRMTVKMLVRIEDDVMDGGEVK